MSDTIIGYGVQLLALGVLIYGLSRCIPHGD